MAIKPTFATPIIRCIDCLHYKGVRHPEFAQPCFKLNQRPGTPAPKCYTPNIPALASVNQLDKVLDVIAKLDEEPTRIMAGLFWSASTLERTEHAFLSKVYFFVGDKNNLADWCFGWLLMKDGQDAHLLSDPKAKKPRYCIVPMNTLKTKADFGVLKEKLLENGKLTASPLQAARMRREEWEPPVFRDVPEPKKKKTRPPQFGFNIDQSEDEENA